MTRFWEELWYSPEVEDGFKRLALWPLQLGAWGYGLATRGRNALYDRSRLAVTTVEGARVVSVGNLTVGGAGKTPAVIFLAQRLLQANRRVAIVSRGYGRTDRNDRVMESGPGRFTWAQVGDEPLLIASRCPGAVVLVGTDKARLAVRARQEFGAEVILVDDGMQHRALARDHDLVVIDESVGFGNGCLLPRGPLREEVSGLARASLIWLCTSPHPRPLPKFTVPVVRAEHSPGHLWDGQGKEVPIDSLRRRRVVALAGVARPERFARTLKELGAEVVGRRFFADHHPFTPAELRAAEEESRLLRAVVVTTEKDGARLPKGFAAWRLGQEVAILAGDALLRRTLGLD